MISSESNIKHFKQINKNNNSLIIPNITRMFSPRFLCFLT